MPTVNPPCLINSGNSMMTFYSNNIERIAFFHWCILLSVCINKVTTHRQRAVMPACDAVSVNLSLLRPQSQRPRDQSATIWQPLWSRPAVWYCIENPPSDCFGCQQVAVFAKRLHGRRQLVCKHLHTAH